MTEYRVPMFEALRRRLAEEGISLKVIYGTPTEKEKARNDEGSLSWAVRIPCHYFKLGSIAIVSQKIPNRLLSGHDLIIIPHENSFIFNYWLLLARLIGRTKIAYWGHGANFQSLHATSLRERFKSWHARHVDWWFAYTSLSKQKVIASGFPEDRITCLNNAVDTGKLIEWRKSIDDSERRSLRRRLGFRGDKVGVFIGSFHRDKRLDFLFSSADELRKRLPDFELLLIGDGFLRPGVRNFVAERSWAHWAGAKHGREKALYLSLGKVMLNPGLVGLGILDSFGMGIPMVTTDCGVHSPEIAYLESGRNGLLTEEGLAAFTEGAFGLLNDPEKQEKLAGACREDAEKYTLGNMVENFCQGITSALAATVDRCSAPAVRDGEKEALPSLHIAIVWQRFLPYHVARIKRLQERCSDLGYRLTAIEVASQDLSYGFEDTSYLQKFKRICCFPGTIYHRHHAREVHRRVLHILKEVQPDIVFAPATAFPEGMAAISYRLSSGSRVVIMDDAWEHTDIRGSVTRKAKRIIHRNADAAFVPARSHLPYYVGLGFPEERVIFGVDVVDNYYFMRAAEKVRSGSETREKHSLPQDYFLFVGRFLPRKGIETLIFAYEKYRSRSEKPWELVLVGSGPHMQQIRKAAENIPCVHFAGTQSGEDLCAYYGFAKALIVPSIRDPWGLVVNEGMASGLPVLVSRGCGAAKTLVLENENGWAFEPENADELAELMLRLGLLPSGEWERMGRRSQEVISDWSLDRFVEGVLGGLNVPRRLPGGAVSNMLARLWKGRVSVN